MSRMSPPQVGHCSCSAQVDIGSGAGTQFQRLNCVRVGGGSGRTDVGGHPPPTDPSESALGRGVGWRGFGLHGPRSDPGRRTGRGRDLIQGGAVPRPSDGLPKAWGWAGGGWGWVGNLDLRIFLIGPRRPWASLRFSSSAATVAVSFPNGSPPRATAYAEAGYDLGTSLPKTIVFLRKDSDPTIPVEGISLRVHPARSAIFRGRRAGMTAPDGC
jgi:hypothetical protein